MHVHFRRKIRNAYAFCFSCAFWAGHSGSICIFIENAHKMGLRGGRIFAGNECRSCVMCIIIGLYIPHITFFDISLSLDVSVPGSIVLGDGTKESGFRADVE